MTANALRDNFSEMGNEDMFEKRVDGMTLYERLLETKVAQASSPSKGQVKTGRVFYDRLRKMYTSSSANEEKLVRRSESETVQPRLFKAMVAEC